MKTKPPLVSVIMPVYNAKDYIRQAVESIRNQSLTDWELLIVDDCSSDGSSQILQELAQQEPRIILFTNKHNLGMARSLNRILPKTKGKYVARMDADDISLPERFAKQVAQLEAKPELVACGGFEQIIDETGEVLAEKQFPTDPKDCYNRQLLYMTIQPPVLMARGEIMRQLRYDTRGTRNGDDISLYFQLLSHGGFSNVAEVIFQYRVLGSSTTHRNVKRSFWMAFGVRVDALLSGVYKPGNIWKLAFVFEALIVAVLPSKLVLKVFELIRNRPQK